jgi:hypothetical protein
VGASRRAGCENPPQLVKHPVLGRI